jgi:hypothetical protein
VRARDEWLSIRGVCAMLHCCEESLRRLRMNHGFPAGRNLNGLSLIRWSRNDIEDWLARREPDDVAPRLDERFQRGTAHSHGAGASAEGGGDDAGMPE